MNKIEFLKKLDKKLRYLPKEDREDAISYYTEYLEDMGISDTDDVSDKLGNPTEIAAGIIAECTEKKLEDNKENGKVKTSTHIVWLIIIAVFSVPILIPLAIAFIIVLLSLVLAAACVIFAGGLCFISIFAVGGIGQKLVCLGAALIVTAIGILMLIGCTALTRLFIILIIKLIKKIVGKEQK